MACIALRPHRVVLGLLTGLTVTAGCVESFDGSNLQMDFSETTPLPGGADYDGLQPPASTYFTFYAVDHLEDDDGNIVQTSLFEVQRFEIRPVINQSSPCFIELEDTRFPGLHVTMLSEKIREATGIDEPLDPPDGVSEGEISDVLNADVRMELLAALQGSVKAVTSFSTFVYPDAEADCNASGDQFPALDCIDDASNAQRLAACRALWADNPTAYEGSDKVFNLPLNGGIFGFAEGPNPKNGGFVGGSTFFVDEVLRGADAYTINWQFKDLDGEDGPDYPDDFFDDGPDTGTLPDRQESDIGYGFMTGRPEDRVRGVINARLVSPFAASAFTEIAIYSGLADDGLHF